MKIRKKKEKSAKKKIKYRRRRTFYRKRFLKIRFPVFFVPSFVISSSSFFFLTNQFIKDIIKLATINKLLRTNRFVISFFFLSFFALSEFANVRPRMDFTIQAILSAVFEHHTQMSTPDVLLTSKNRDDSRSNKRTLN